MRYEDKIYPLQFAVIDGSFSHTIIGQSGMDVLTLDWKGALTTRIPSYQKLTESPNIALEKGPAGLKQGLEEVKHINHTNRLTQ